MNVLREKGIQLCNDNDDDNTLCAQAPVISQCSLWLLFPALLTPPTTTPQGQDSSNAITLYTGHLIRKDRNYYSQWEGKENEAQKVSVAAKGHAACVCRL